MPPALPHYPRPEDNPRRSSDHSYNGLGPAGVSYPSRAASDIAGSLSLSMADFFAEALDSAISLVRADGGELAMLDTTRQVFVQRARARQPRLDGAPRPTGAPSRPSQPIYPPPPSGGPSSGRDRGGMRPPVFTPPLAGPLAGPRADPEGLDQQSTILMPAAPGAPGAVERIFRRGVGLIGQVWQQGEPITMSGEQYRDTARGDTARGGVDAGLDAPWHLSVPIFRPGPLSNPYRGEEILGAISVYRRDSLWSFSGDDIQRLILHADRVARALRVTELAREDQSRGELLEVLGAASSTAPNLPALYIKVRDIVRHLVDAPSFAVVRYSHHPTTPEVSFELAERDGAAVSADRMPATNMPPWWHEVRARGVFSIASQEDRAAHPEQAVLGWGGGEPVQSLIAAPMISGSGFVGAIVAGSPLPNAYAPEHLPLFKTLAHAAGILIENTQLAADREAALKRATERAGNLFKLDNALLTLNATLDVQATTKAVVEHAALFTGARVSMVFLLDEAGKQLVASESSWRLDPPYTPLHEIKIPLDWQNMRRILDEEPYIVLDDPASAENTSPGLGRALAEYGILSCLILPMHHPIRQESRPVTGPLKKTSEHLGALLVYDPGTRYHFTMEEIRLLQTLAAQASVAISNAQLYHDLAQAYEKQKELDRLKDNFILTVSHEFRTPLTAIKGYISLIDRHADRLDQAQFLKYGEEIRQAADNLTGMVDALADANKLEDEPLHLTLSPVNVSDMAATAIASQPPEAKGRILVEIPAALWVSGDAKRLATVITNLVSNALKYSPEGSSCRITARVETREALARQRPGSAPARPGAPERWAVVGVLDSGMGISPADQEKLFHKFVRLEKSLTTNVRGTGLGLWICRKYLDAMGGDIWVTSALNQGSHFQFYLPLAQSPEG